MIKEWSSEPDAKNSPEEENSRQLTLLRRLSDCEHSVIIIRFFECNELSDVDLHRRATIGEFQKTCESDCVGNVWTYSK